MSCSTVRFEEYPHRTGIELRTRHAQDFRLCRIKRQCFPVWPIRSHRIQRVDHGKQAGTPRDGFPAQSARVAGAVEALLVTQHDVRGLPHAGHLRHDAIAHFRMSAHFLPFAVAQRPLLEQDRVRDSDLADIVQ